jgi:hypothetical protein
MSAQSASPNKAVPIVGVLQKCRSAFRDLRVGRAIDSLKTIALFRGVRLLVSLLVVVGLTLPALGSETLDVLDWI